MSKSIGIRLLAGILVIGMLFGGASFGTAAASDSSSDDRVGNLKDALNTISFRNYYEDHKEAAFDQNGKPNNAGAASIKVNLGEYTADANLKAMIEAKAEKAVKALGEGALYLPATGEVVWQINVEKAGFYTSSFSYYTIIDAADSKLGIPESKDSSIERSFYIDGVIPFYEATYLSMTKAYKNFVNDKVLDGTDVKFTQDITGNQMRPVTKMIEAKRSYTFKDSTGYNVEALQFYLTEGTHTIKLYAQREAVVINNWTFDPVEQEYKWAFDTEKGGGTAIRYEQYLKDLQADGAKDVELKSNIKYEAEISETTSDITLYPTNDRTSCITSPQHPAKQRLNTIGGGSTDSKKWTTVGQWIRYKVEVPESGFYTIAPRFAQTMLAGSFVSRQLRVQLPGESEATVPFYEASYLRFGYSDDWQIGFLSFDGKTPIKVYLEKGVNYVEFEANLGQMADIIYRVDDSLDNITSAYSKILMLVGTNPDEYRDYNFNERIPDAVEELALQARNLESVVKDLKAITKTKGSHVATLETVIQLLKKMGKNESEIAGNLTSLKSNMGTLGTWISDSRESPLEFDYFLICSGNATKKVLPEATAGFFATLWYEIKMFFASFVSDYDTLGVLDKKSLEAGAVEVWYATDRDRAQILRNLITNEFTAKEGGCPVNMKLVAGGSLLPPVLAGVGPDVSLGHGSSDVINWAIRSALVELTDFEGAREITGFDHVIAELRGEDKGDSDKAWFTTSATVPLTLHEVITEESYNALSEADKKKYDKFQAKETDSDEMKEGKYYEKFSLWGLPMEQSFNVMFYRADIFNELGIEPPKTWDDLNAIIGVLSANNMEIAMPTSLGGFQMFLYQNNGDLYSNGGQTISFELDNSLESFEMLCEFFQQYKFPVAYDFSNRFRTGEIPIGIVPYGTYTQLSLYATEIKGLWEFVPMPGMIVGYEEDGTPIINNDSVSGTSASIMLTSPGRSDEKTKNAWEFMKWFSGKTCQVSYANELTALLGTESKHSTANREALEALPWTSAELASLKSQFENLAGIPEYPGSYIIARYVNFAFLDVVNNNADPIESLRQYVTAINSELSRKRQEFGLAYMD